MDPRLFTQQVRDRYKVPEATYPSPVCPLMTTGYKGDPYSKSSGNGSGNGGKPSKMRKPNHGGVPGLNYDSRQQQISFPKAAAAPAAGESTGGTGAAGGGSGGGWASGASGASGATEGKRCE